MTEISALGGTLGRMVLTVLGVSLMLWRRRSGRRSSSSSPAPYGPLVGTQRVARLRLSGKRRATMAGRTHQAGRELLLTIAVAASAAITATAMRQSSPTMKSYQNFRKAVIFAVTSGPHR
jgi:hypothetical protein